MSKFYVLSEQDLTILAEADYLSEAYDLADGINDQTIISPNPPEASKILWQQKKQSLKS